MTSRTAVNISDGGSIRSGNVGKSILKGQGGKKGGILRE
jgi:hypothetical protein